MKLGDIKLTGYFGVHFIQGYSALLFIGYWIPPSLISSSSDSICTTSRFVNMFGIRTSSEQLFFSRIKVESESSVTSTIQTQINFTLDAKSIVGRYHSLTCVCCLALHTLADYAHAPSSTGGFQRAMWRLNWVVFHDTFLLSWIDKLTGGIIILFLMSLFFKIIQSGQPVTQCHISLPWKFD